MAVPARTGAPNDDETMLARLRRSQEQVNAALASGGATLQVALTERFEARRALIEEYAGKLRDRGPAAIAAQLDAVARDTAEHLLVFDGASNRLLHVRGTESEVAFPPDDLPSGKTPADQWRGAVLAHSHPAGVQLTGLTPEDAWQAARITPEVLLTWYETDGTAWVQTLRAPRGWPAADAFYNRFIERYNEVVNEHRGTIRASAFDDPMHVALERTARDFGLSYQREER